MKTQADNIHESQNSLTPKVESESSNGGTAQLVDNRSSTIVQRKLQDSMSVPNENNISPIQRKANNTGLPDNLKSGIENLSGYSMDDVKVHYNSSKPAQLQAHAYAQGTNIHLGSGQEKHLAHEAWHVVQQKQGRVQPTKQLKSKVSINDDTDLEKEADVMGLKALNNANNSKSISLKSDDHSVDQNVAQGYFFEGRHQHSVEDDLRDGIKREFYAIERYTQQGVLLGFSDGNDNLENELNILSQMLWNEYGEREDWHMEMDIIRLAYKSCLLNFIDFEAVSFFDVIVNFNRARINLPWSVRQTMRYDMELAPNRTAAMAAIWSDKKRNPAFYKLQKSRAVNRRVNQPMPAPRNAPLANPNVEIPVGSLFLNRGGSVQNPESDTLILGRYRPSFPNRRDPNWGAPGKDSYVGIAREKQATHFNMGSSWDSVKENHEIDSDNDMFLQLNIPVLQSAIDTNKKIIFTHHPEADRNSMLYKEWVFLRDKGYTQLTEDKHGFWEATKP